MQGIRVGFDQTLQTRVDIATFVCSPLNALGIVSILAYVNLVAATNLDKFCEKRRLQI